MAESIVINDLKEKLLNPKSISILADKLIVHYQKMQQEESGDLKVFEKRLNEIEEKINNIVKAIADGMYNQSMKAAIDKLEQEKAYVVTMINDIRNRMLCTALDKDMIIKYLEKDMKALQNKSPDDVKKIIQTYVERVNVYEEHVEVLLVVHTNGGGEGTCASNVSIGTDYILNSVVRYTPLRSAGIPFMLRNVPI